MCYMHFMNYIIYYSYFVNSFVCVYMNTSNIDHHLPKDVLNLEGKMNGSVHSYVIWINCLLGSVWRQSFNNVEENVIDYSNNSFYE